MNDAPTSHPVAMSPPRDPGTAHEAIIKLLIRYEAALGQAWTAECSPHISHSRLTKVWDNAQAWRSDLVNAIHAALADNKRDMPKSVPSLSPTPARGASPPESLPESNNQSETP